MKGTLRLREVRSFVQVAPRTCLPGPRGAELSQHLGTFSRASHQTGRWAAWRSALGRRDQTEAKLREHPGEDARLGGKPKSPLASTRDVRPREAETPRPHPARRTAARGGERAGLRRRGDWSAVLVHAERENAGPTPGWRGAPRVPSPCSTSQAPGQPRTGQEGTPGSSIQSAGSL